MSSPKLTTCSIDDKEPTLHSMDGHRFVTPLKQRTNTTTAPNAPSRGKKILIVDDIETGSK